MLGIDHGADPYQAAWCFGRVILCTIKSLKGRWQSDLAYHGGTQHDCLCGISSDHLIGCFEIGATFWTPAYIGNRPTSILPWSGLFGCYDSLFEWLAVVRTAIDSRVSPVAGVFASVIAVLVEVLGHELGGTLYAIWHQLDGATGQTGLLRRELVWQFADGLEGAADRSPRAARRSSSDRAGSVGSVGSAGAVQSRDRDWKDMVKHVKWAEARDHHKNRKDMVKHLQDALSACPHLNKSGSLIEFAIYTIFGTTERDLRRSPRIRELMSDTTERHLSRPRMWRPVADTPLRTLHTFEALRCGPFF